MKHNPRKYDTGQIDDVAKTGNRSMQDKIQKGAKNNRSKHTNEPANIEPKGRPKA